MNSLAARLVASASIWCAAVLAVGGVLLSQLFSDYVERSFDERLHIHLENLAAVSEPKDDVVTVEKALADSRFERPYSGLYWQISTPDGRPLVRSRSLWDATLVDSGKRQAREVEYFDAAGPDEQQLRIHSRAISLSNDASHRLLYAVGADTSELRSEISRFNQVLIRSLTLLGIGLLSAVLIQVHFGLKPLRRIKEALTSMRSGRTARLESKLPSEITPLADELNALLDHNAEIVERARTHVGNLAHALKTPLSIMQNECRNDSSALASVVGNQTSVMRRHVDYYLSRARTAGTTRLISARTDVGDVLAGIARTLERVHAEKGLALSVQCVDTVLFRGERQDLEEIVGNLADNACKWADRQVSILGEAKDQHVIITVEDDGSGLAPERHKEVLQRGKRLDEQVSGSGLGLSIVKDIVELYGGEIDLNEATLGGLAVHIKLPRAIPG